MWKTLWASINIHPPGPRIRLRRIAIIFSNKNTALTMHQNGVFFFSQIKERRLYTPSETTSGKTIASAAPTSVLICKEPIGP